MQGAIPGAVTAVTAVTQSGNRAIDSQISLPPTMAFHKHNQSGQKQFKMLEISIGLVLIRILGDANYRVGPHPKTDKCRTKVGNVGDVKGKNIGLAHVIRQIPGGAHSEVWVDLGNGFKPIGKPYEGKCGKIDWSTGPNSDQQAQFRCDCANVAVDSNRAVVYEI